jgi:hypothetical protein
MNDADINNNNSSTIYEIDYAKPGVLLIFNNMIFRNQKHHQNQLLQRRDNSHLDVARLTRLFGEKLNFHIVSCLDLTASEMREKVREYASKDFENNTPITCFICIVMSHCSSSDGEKLLASDSNQIAFSDIVTPFKRNSTLKYKPKLFFNFSTCDVTSGGDESKITKLPALVNSAVDTDSNGGDLFCAYSIFSSYGGGGSGGIGGIGGVDGEILTSQSFYSQLFVKLFCDSIETRKNAHLAEIFAKINEDFATQARLIDNNAANSNKKKNHLNNNKHHVLSTLNKRLYFFSQTAIALTATRGNLANKKV